MVDSVFISLIKLFFSIILRVFINMVYKIYINIHAKQNVSNKNIEIYLRNSGYLYSKVFF